jgi:hypothetical protein
VYSLPDIATYFMVAMPLLLLAATWLSYKSWRKSRTVL